MTSRRSLATLAIAILAASTHLPAHADTECHFGGPTPGYKAIRLNLPQGTDYLGIELHGAHGTRPADNGSSWHLAQGIVVLNADTFALEAYRVSSSGTHPRRVVVRDDGDDVASQQIYGPDGPFTHRASRLRAGLPPGSYYVIAWGSDGSNALPNDWWSADVRLAGNHTCGQIATGEVFDFDHTEFEGGTQVYAAGVGHAEDLHLGFTTPRALVVGLLDASVQIAGDASLAYTTPSKSGTITDEIIPLVSVGGTFSFTGEYQGIHPLLSVAGVALDLSA